MKLLTPLISLSTQVLGQIPDGGWIRDPMNIDTNLQTCGFFDIDDGVTDSTRVLDSDRIINGVTADMGTWPWIVSFAELGFQISNFPPLVESEIQRKPSIERKQSLCWKYHS